MNLSLLAAALSAALLGGCQAQSAPVSPGGEQGWRAGPSSGPMMAYGYCPGAPTGSGAAQQGWYGPGMMGERGGGPTPGSMMGGNGGGPTGNGMMSGGGARSNGGGMMGGGDGSWMGGPMMGGGRAFDPQQATAWLGAAKTQIGITAPEEQAWSTYAAAVQADRAAMYEMHEQMPAMMNASGVNAPDRLQAHLDLMQARLAPLQQVQTTSRALFDLLTPEQRQLADQTLWSGCW